MDITRLAALIASKAELSLQSDVLRGIIPPGSHPDAIEYFEHLLPTEMYIASGVRVKTSQGILEENEESVAPGGYIAPYGYLVIATSIGGNAICIDCQSGATYWVDRSSFTEDLISYEERYSGEWIDLPFSEDNIPKALVLIESNLDAFIEKLLYDQLEELFDTLD